MYIARQIQVAQLHIDKVVCRIRELSKLQNRHDVSVSLSTEFHNRANFVVDVALIRPRDVEQLSGKRLFQMSNPYL